MKSFYVIFLSSYFEMSLVAGAKVETCDSQIM